MKGNDDNPARANRSGMGAWERWRVKIPEL